MDEGAAAAAPGASDGLKHFRGKADNFRLLRRGQPDHSELRVRISERREDPVTDPEIRMPVMRAFHRAGQGECETAKLLGSHTVEPNEQSSSSQDRNRIGDKTADRRHHDETDEEYNIGKPFQSMVALPAARPQCPVGGETRDQKNNRIKSEQIIGKGVRLAQSDHDPEESNHRQADADHPG